jgi:trehalose-6-phosphate synthase
MSKRIISNGEYSGYSPANDLLQIETEIATILYVVGLDGQNIDGYEIDEIINEIRLSFHYSNERYKNSWYAYDALNRKYSNTLCVAIRRLHRWKKIARYVDQNG